MPGGFVSAISTPLFDLPYARHRSRNVGEWGGSLPGTPQPPPMPLQSTVGLLMLCQAFTCTAGLERPYERLGSTRRPETHAGTRRYPAVPRRIRRCRGL